MRRTDRQQRLLARWKLHFFQPAVPLPHSVHREFVDMLFSMRLPVVGLAMVFVGIATLAAVEWRDPWFGALAVAGGVVTVLRLLTIEGYWQAGPVTDMPTLKHWELRYAVGNYAFALLLALLNARALTYHYPLLHLLTVSLVFSFGAGLVSRISIRPKICIASLLLATVPTVVALGLHAFGTHPTALHVEMFAIEALIVAMITALSLQTVGHLYRSAVTHHTAEHNMMRLARHDALTGLPNRLLLRERFEASLAAAAATGTRLAVHFIDLDGFKAINDNRGHPAGDMVLREVASRLEGTVRADDTVARLGGDEFVVIQTDVSGDGEAELLARRIIKRLSTPYATETGFAHISASIGMALSPDHGRDFEALLACADAALYRSKTAGKARASFCAPEDVELGIKAVA